MQGIGGKYFALAAAVAIFGAGFAAHAQDQTKAAAPQPNSAAAPSQEKSAPQPTAAPAPVVSAAMHKKMEAKLSYCKTCHGVQGQGFRGAFPMPRLAGQQPDYIKNQLQAFIQKRRANPVMNNVAHVLSPEMVDFLSKSFHDLNPPPLGGAPAALVPEGKEIFHNGVPSKDIPPCATCHGDDAKGNGEIPRLAGQLNDYIIRKLTNFDKERGLKPSPTDVSSLMKPIAHNLTQQQIAAVAAYVSNLK
ncbi:c-type cytochrome [Rhodoblastus acidophilus]|uniref:C-type cytochrome n=1 Tax=Candidatus Rhodoblastus alkanivorans TaxID=2954117 RepID=A0ABS9Z2U2_9HYPH|nr:c-type cytochrome [Candidatus Rhodoblastus alkanivorans]MCI4678024.1 c-type cytochrome [Candidatus Rhodoblastus alkanivorans]MCI4681635.1 c-type cytochrome [Candidatus Rhodoblastus alkanivorans]MDI4642683.1 c-type cytochrome [Rhodoblastus acidophilus]